MLKAALETKLWSFPAFRHLEHNLHVGSIWALTDKKWIWMLCDRWESKNYYPGFK